ncbi:hypothetical protein C5167_041049 [Papaver somniferum]|uniref:Transmembrane protein n=1 Tax=Papaver somniferum TaxID=3469 RepID=A0A4Y7IKW9_PAPSO|nr:hypothetical protein C5167_041049 [Papaver somniferum]
MASMSTKTTLIMFCVAAAMFVAASAQDVSSPAPSPDKGAASIGLPISSAFLCSWLVVSLIALLKH